MRKTLTYVVQDEGRDKGKAFLLTEMPATKAERWAIRALLAIAAGGIDLPEDVKKSGVLGLAKVGLDLLMGVSFELADPLLGEMLECIQIIPNPSNKAVVRALVEDDIEEIATLFKLRKEVFYLHVNFSQAGAQLTSESPAPAPTDAASSTISIPRRRSQR